MSDLLNYLHFLAHMPAYIYAILAMSVAWLILRITANRRIKSAEDTVWTIIDDQPRKPAKKVVGPRYCYICKKQVDDDSLSKCPTCGFEI